MILFENSVYPHTAVIWKTTDRPPTSGSSGQDGKEGEVRPADVLNPVAASERIEDVCQAGDEVVSDAFCSLESLQGEDLVGEILKRGKAAFRLNDVWDSFLAQGINGQRTFKKGGKDFFFYRDVDDFKDKVKLLANYVDLESVLDCFQTDANAKIEQNPWRIIYADKDGNERIFYLEMGKDFLARAQKSQGSPHLKLDETAAKSHAFEFKDTPFNSPEYKETMARSSGKVRELIDLAEKSKDAREKINLLLQALDLARGQFQLKIDILERLKDCDPNLLRELTARGQPQQRYGFDKEDWFDRNMNSALVEYENDLRFADGAASRGSYVNAMLHYWGIGEEEQMREMMQKIYEGGDPHDIAKLYHNFFGLNGDGESDAKMWVQRSAEQYEAEKDWNGAALEYKELGNLTKSHECFLKAAEQFEHEGEIGSAAVMREMAKDIES